MEALEAAARNAAAERATAEEAAARNAAAERATAEKAATEEKVLTGPTGKAKSSSSNDPVKSGTKPRQKMCFAAGCCGCFAAIYVPAVPVPICAWQLL